MLEKISTLSFPGLGIGEFQINSVAFSLFGHDIAWYGVIITLGIILAVAYVMFRAKQVGIKEDDILDLALFVVPIGIICARIYYVLMKLEDYHSFYDVIAIWNGGLAIYGGIIGGAVTAYFVARHKKINVLQLLDILASAVLIGQILGRWGNFMNAEAFGEATTLPWRMGIHYAMQTIYVHPTFFYESFWNLIALILINVFWRKKQYHGQAFFFYISWYGFGRYFVEGLRTDSLYLGATGIRVSQLVGAVCFFAGAGLMIYHAIRQRKSAGSAKSKKAEDISGQNAELTENQTVKKATEATGTGTLPATDVAEEKEEHYGNPD